MPNELLKLAYSNGVVIEYFDKPLPYEAFFYQDDGLPPTVFMSKNLFKSVYHYRSVLGHELGHFFTTQGSRSFKPYLTFREQVENDICEYRANKWAANYLVPQLQLDKAIREGRTSIWELMDVFRVDEQTMLFRLELYQRAGLEEINNYAETKRAPNGAFGVF
jgi:Zn-dependent peptidase ImmA (M78 family)